MNPKTLLTTNASALPEASALPADPALPGYASLCEPSRLNGVLSRVVARWLGPDVRLLNSGAHVRRLRPGKRCSVELELMVGRDQGALEHRRLLGKFYRDDRGATVYQTLVELRKHGLGTGRLLVPEPVAWMPEYNLLLLAWAEGESLSSVLLAGSDAEQGVKGAAAWLLGLHNCGVAAGRRYSFLGHLRTLFGWKELLTEVYPKGERLLGALLARLEERGSALSGWAPGPTHRDFSPEHLVVQTDRFTCLDFDEFCQYDPLFDVAHFTAHLRFLGLTHFGALNHFDWLSGRFLAAYEAGSHDYSEERLNLYLAIAYFKLGRFVALVQRPKEWLQMLPELLSEARRFV